MWTRPEVRIKRFDIQKMIDDFTGSTRDFTAFSSTKIDHMVRFYVHELKDFMYSRFDTATDELVFKGPPEIDNNWFASRGLENIRVHMIDRPLNIRLIGIGNDSK